MFEISDFYHYCKQHDVDVIPYDGCPKPGATIRDGSFYAVFLDFTKIKSTRKFHVIKNQPWLMNIIEFFYGYYTY